ncbi:hypothetical protein [Bradyrhizobium iriomotense]|uniref:hypothetical protein n=1 Tax=Bradyrhizobium iriomotense TaxID=441950 RepID=UPI001B8A08C4|nr:hypothetical protein [Bradyrhizobium iriomotense]
MFQPAGEISDLARGQSRAVADRNNADRNNTAAIARAASAINRGDRLCNVISTSLDHHALCKVACDSIDVAANGGRQGWFPTSPNALACVRRRSLDAAFASAQRMSSISCERMWILVVLFRRGT